MEEILKEPKDNPKKEPSIQLCGYCHGWCYEGEYFHHDPNCTRPDRDN